MTSEEILKALIECTTADGTCEKCPYHERYGAESCIEEVFKDAIELIKKQREEIERWQKELILKNNTLIIVKSLVNQLPQAICDNTSPDFNKDGKAVNVWKAKSGYDDVFALIKQIMTAIA